MDGVTAGTTTVVGVLGEDPLVARILLLLLEGAGYEARALDGGAVLDAPSAALAGVDLVLLMPRLGDEREGALLDVMKRPRATAAVPVLILSTVPREGLDERTGSVPWPCSIGALERAIEQAVLAPAPTTKHRRTIRSRGADRS